MQKKILAIQGSSLKKVNVETDTTLFLALEAQKRGYQIYYYEPQNLSFIDGKVIVKCFQLTFLQQVKQHQPPTKPGVYFSGLHQPVSR